MYGKSYYYRLYKDYESKESDCQERMTALETFKATLRKVIKNVKSAADNLSAATLTLETDGIVDGRPYDKGEFGVFSSNLTSMVGDFEEVLQEIDGVIDNLRAKKDEYRILKDDNYTKYLNAK